MDAEERISRRKFFKILSFILAIPFSVFSFRAVKTSSRLAAKKDIKIDIQTLQNTVNFTPDYIIIKSGKVKVLFSACSHLGCKINKFERDLLVCPCHGSKFDLNGNVVSGPAVNNLKEADFRTDNTNNMIIISGDLN